VWEAMRRKRHPAVDAYIQAITSAGGRARAEALTPAARTKIARKGGKTLQASRSPEERKAAALKAVEARWAKWRAAKKRSQ
jgi:hypothetical protein